MRDPGNEVGCPSNREFGYSKITEKLFFFIFLFLYFLYFFFIATLIIFTITYTYINYNSKNNFLVCLQYFNKLHRNYTKLLRNSRDKHQVSVLWRCPSYRGVR